VTLEIHHVFVCAPRPREGVAALVEAGFVEGSGRTHPGQGTANARFFFDGGFFEILWAVDERELDHEAVRPTALRQRMASASHDACPFGIAFRSPLPWPPAWQYAAPFLPAGHRLPMWNRSGDARDPLLFAVPPASTDAPPDEEPRVHQAGTSRYRISAIELYTPTPPPFPDTHRIADGAWSVGPLVVQLGVRHWMKVVLRSDAGPLHVCLEPSLPVDIVA
jgi:hypothetical protein